MLVLSRQIGEAIVIEGSIRITVTAAKGGNVRLAIQAPKKVRVDRAEVHARRRGFESRGPVQGHRAFSS